MKKPLHENWRDYTEDEINDIKEEKCKKCQYSAPFQYSYCADKKHIMCDYLGKTGHMRGCRPEQCEHYKDEEIIDISRSNDFENGIFPDTAMMLLNSTGVYKET